MPQRLFLSAAEELTFWETQENGAFIKYLWVTAQQGERFSEVSTVKLPVA